MWSFSEEKKRMLHELCRQYAPTSYEWAVQKVLASSFNKIGVECRGDAIGNLYAPMNEDSDFQITIVAHADEIGMQITEINAQGLLRFRKLGGLRATSLVGHKVVVLTQSGIVNGVVGCDPLQDNGTETGILVKTSDLWIDIGAESQEQCSSMVEIGNYALFESDFVCLGDNRIASKALDDRLGIYVMYQAMQVLKNENLSIGVTAISSVQEEIRLRGVAACRESFDAAIIVDVDFATDIPTEHSRMGLLELGKGIGVNLNADSNIVLRELFEKLMNQKSIPVQKTLSRNISGGTDATQMQINGNIATLNINIPLRYMHSHYEICDKRDLESAVRAIVELVKFIDCNKIKNFVPWQQI